MEPTEKMEVVQVEQQAPRPLAVVAAPGLELITAAVQRGASIEELRELMAMRKEMREEAAKEAFVAAMAEFKRNPPRIEKTRTANVSSRKGEGASYAYKFANLADVCDKIVARLAECSISHDWATRQIDGAVEVTCTLTHQQGHSKSTKLSSGLDTSGGKNALQALGSAVSYLERYTLLAACGMAVDDQQDNDGAGVTEAERAEMRGAAQGMRQRARPADVAAGRGKQKAPGQSLLDQARATADKGHAEFGPYWRGLDPDVRAQLAGELDDLQARASAAKGAA